MRRLSRNEKIAVVVALVVVFIFSLLPNSKLSFNGILMNKKTGTENINSMNNIDNLIIQDVLVGEGASAKVGDTVSVHYVGNLANGEVFDSSIEKNRPFVFKLGEGVVIAGWDQGLLRMKVGGRRILIIPSNLGYGDKGIGPIPPNSTLRFEIELLDIKENVSN